MEHSADGTSEQRRGNESRAAATEYDQICAHRLRELDSRVAWLSMRDGGGYAIALDSGARHLAQPMMTRIAELVADFFSRLGFVRLGSV